MKKAEEQGRSKVWNGDEPGSMFWFWLEMLKKRTMIGLVMG